MKKKSPLSNLPHWFDADKVRSEAATFFDALILELKPLSMEFGPDRDTKINDKIVERTKELNVRLLTWSGPHLDLMSKRMHAIAKGRNRGETIAKAGKARGRILDALIAIVSVELQRVTTELAVSAPKIA